MLALGLKAAWLTIKRSLVTIYNDVYDEHLFVFAAGLSYYFVLSLFPLLVSMASLLGYTNAIAAVSGVFPKAKPVMRPFPSTVA